MTLRSRIRHPMELCLKSGVGWKLARSQYNYGQVALPLGLSPLHVRFIWQHHHKGLRPRTRFPSLMPSLRMRGHTHNSSQDQIERPSIAADVISAAQHATVLPNTAFADLPSLLSTTILHRLQALPPHPVHAYVALTTCVHQHPHDIRFTNLSFSLYALFLLYKHYPSHFKPSQ